MQIVRVRFAPSPTGYLHIGGARTAIFNWLYARNTGGQFLLRIEDTDRERSKQEYQDDILEALRWLGMDWDEEPLFQSSRKSFHREMCEELLDRGAAYRCFLNPEETTKIRKELERQLDSTAFRSPYRNISREESEELAAQGKPYAVRFLVPDADVIVEDAVHGPIKRRAADIEDFVILRSDGSPTYQAAVVADDYEMGITHVIRGDDHQANAAKQVLLYKALGWKPPVFAHVPLILGPDKKRLSKRHGATAVTEYRQQGFLADSLFSFLALLGWSPGDDRELMTRDELVNSFSLSGINNHSAVFDERKLEWMNGQFISMCDDEVLIDLLKQPFAQRVADGIFPPGSAKMLPTAVRLLKTRSHFPIDILDRGDYFFKDPESLDPKAAKKRLKDEKTPDLLEELAEKYLALDEFAEESVEQALREMAEAHEIGAGKLIHPTRLAVSGQGAGPGLFELLVGLGRETVVRRLKDLARFLREKGTPPALGE